MKISNKATGLLSVLVPTVVLAGSALAYTTGTETGTDALGSMDSLLTDIVEWIEGPLGTLIAVACLIVGLGMGIMQQSIMAAVVGIAMGAVVNYGPKIIQGVAGASDNLL
jgi:conjugal transfer pilus assembly protein TraA